MLDIWGESIDANDVLTLRAMTMENGKHSLHRYGSEGWRWVIGEAEIVHYFEPQYDVQSLTVSEKNAELVGDLVFQW
jgi:hypothetical protein